MHAAYLCISDLMIVGSSDANMPTELVFTDGAKGIEFDVRERVVFDHGVSLRSEGASQEHYCTFQAPLNDTVIYFDNLAPEMVGDEQVRIGLYTWPLYDQRTIKDITLGQCTLTTHPHVFDETRVLVDVEDMCKYKISAVINLEFIQECKLPLRKMGSEMSHVASWSVVFTEYFDSDSEGRALNTPISRDMEYDGETIINVDQDTGASIVDVQQNKYDTSTLQTLTVLSHAWIVNDVDTEDLGVKLVVRVPEPFHMSNHSDGAVRQFVDADGNPITSTGLTQQQVIDQLIDRQQAAANKAATNAADHTNDTAPINQDQLYEMIAHPPAPENEPVVFPSTYPRPSPNNYNIQQGEPLTPEQIQTIKDHLLNRIKSVTNDVNDTVPESRTDSSTVVIPVGEKGKIAITAQVDKPAGAVGSEGSIKPHIDVTGQVHKPAPGDDSDGTTKPHIDISATLGIEKTKTERRQAQGTTDTVQVTQYSGIGSFMVDIWKKRGGSTRVGQAEIFEDCQINEETKGCEQQVNVKATADTSANSNTDSSSQDNGVGVAGVVSICLALLLVVLLVGSGIYFYRSRKARSIKQEVMDFSRSPSMQSNADSRHAFGDTDEMSTSNVTSAITMVDKAGDMCDERMKV
ncbi:hypothetical protein SARC_02334 [Sphaeroforma arctica JP610]|uniref:Uncharacterized protein n=1 Tax=Sphaeroforma arctica JP610 TaxID=667725 RepID=A0A0L0G8Z1_9EUKA|nr:hypothetical protein SARC_02334 [Sphaeroforma arctica JP610]KNC85497.1 hypothetical protein SARC_02334 [Sphaeroforma arctica JP610]|eukprot:XP_014159399.1 hypothetical protein SARC_02334 [Sphaeroforma arctica JP610]